MKYWLYLIAKMAVAALVMCGLQAILVYKQPHAVFLHDMLYTFMTLWLWLIGAGMFYLVLWDQRRRCRTCLRRLIMPIATGSWGHLVIYGRPKTELICPFGHGTLRI